MRLPDHDQLSESHDQVLHRLVLLAGDPDLNADQRSLAGDVRRYLERARQRAEGPVRIAFLAEVGVGKSTAIAQLAGLWLEGKDSAQTSAVLPTGKGRTTLGETRIVFEDRADVELEVTPVPAEELERELRIFAEDTWRQAQGVGAADDHSSEELGRVFRAWASLTGEQALDLARASATTEDLLSALHARLAVAAHTRPFARTFASAALPELRACLADLMKGKLADGPVPDTTTLRLPTVGLPVDELIDTQGVDADAPELAIAGRSDLHELLADRDVLCVVCSRIERVPDAVASACVKAIVDEDQRQQASSERAVRVLIIDRDGVGGGEEAEQERKEKVEQCRRGFAQKNLVVSGDEIAVVNPVRERERLVAIVHGLADAARRQRADAWRDAIDQATASLAPLADFEQAALMREWDLRLWWAWDAALATAPPVATPEPLTSLASLIRARDPALGHWSQLYAAIRRRGFYQRRATTINLAALASRAAAIAAVTPQIKAMAAVRALGAGDAPQEIVAHVARRQQAWRDALSAWWARTVTAEWQRVVRQHFQSSASDDLWETCTAAWGSGTGFVLPVAARFEREQQLAAAALRPPDTPEVETTLPPRPPLFRLESVKVRNFRGIVDAELALGAVTVLVGGNGLGKTSWLEAIASGLSTLVSGIDGTDLRQVASDVRAVVQTTGAVADAQPQLPMILQLTGQLQARAVTWSRVVEAGTTDAAPPADDPVRRITANIGAELRSHARRELPVFCYYGTQRLWPPDLPVTDHARVGSRQDGYRDALRAAPTHEHMRDWVRKYTMVALQRKQEVPQLRAIEAAVLACVEGASAFTYDVANEELRLTMRDGAIVPFRTLSDGFRNIIAMVADIAWRASVLNPELGARAPELVEGLVLIDEIDLHLHPQWQRRVLPDLVRTFPRVQFVVTTHSPQVVSTARPESLRILQPDGTVALATYTHGRDTNSLLREIFGTSERPSDAQRRIDQIEALLGQGDLAGARAALTELAAELGPDDDALQGLTWELHDQEVHGAPHDQGT